MWNGINYLLKMPSDLDYLADYQAIKKWTGFQLTRNPFTVPFPMDEGVNIHPGIMHGIIRCLLLSVRRQYSSWSY